MLIWQKRKRGLPKRLKKHRNNILLDFNWGNDARWGILRVNHYPYVVRNTFNINYWKTRHTKIFLVFLRNPCIRMIKILIFSFDNNMCRIAYLTRDSYQYLIREGLWKPFGNAWGDSNSNFLLSLFSVDLCIKNLTSLHTFTKRK